MMGPVSALKLLIVSKCVSDHALSGVFPPSADTNIEGRKDDGHEGDRSLLLGILVMFSICCLICSVRCSVFSFQCLVSSVCSFNVDAFLI